MPNQPLRARDVSIERDEESDSDGDEIDCGLEGFDVAGSIVGLRGQRWSDDGGGEEGE
jgi:hypothetical protein